MVTVVAGMHALGRSQLGAGRAVLHIQRMQGAQGFCTRRHPDRLHHAAAAAVPVAASTAVTEVPADIKKVLFTTEQVQQRVKEL